MRGTAAGEGPARPADARGSSRVKRWTREMCSFIEFRLPHAKISGPQGGVKYLLFGCERPKSECFRFPRVGTEHDWVPLPVSGGMDDEMLSTMDDEMLEFLAGVVCRSLETF
jgi:hypothetical protein